MSIELKIEKADLDELNRKLDEYRKNAGKSLYEAMVALAFEIKNQAALRLKSRGHIATSRLINSIYVQAKNPVMPSSYSSDEGSFDAKLKTIQLGENDVAVGSNVTYAAAIELGHKPIEINSPVKIKGVGWRYIKTLPATVGDSFLYWAFKNVDFNKTLTQKMKENIINPKNPK